MIFKNKLFNIVEKFFDNYSEYHNRANDLMIRYELTKGSKKPDQIILTGPTHSKILENNITKYNNILNQHYVLYGNSYQIIDSNIFTILMLNKLEPGLSIDDSFPQSIINDKVDYYMKLEQSPKETSVIELKNILETLKIKAKSAEEQLKTTKNNPRLEADLNYYLEEMKMINSHIDVLQESHFSNMVKLGLGFKLPHSRGDANVIKNENLRFISSIRRFGHSIQRYFDYQQFLMFDYLNGTDLPLYKYYVSPDNIAIGGLQPFIYANFVPTNAIIIGNYFANNIPITGDLWDELAAQNGAIIGITGSGKSATSKAFLTRNFIIKNRRIIIIDPQREYLFACRSVGGEYIDILANTGGDSMSINIFDRANYETDLPNAFDLKINDIIRFFSFASASSTMLESGESIQTSLESNPIFYQFTENLIKAFYLRFGIKSLEDLENVEDVPTLDDFINYIATLKEKLEKDYVFDLGEKYITKIDINFSNYLEAFKLISNACETLSSSEFNIFKGKTKMNLNNKFVVFNTHDLSKRMNILSTYVIMNYVVKTMSSDSAEEKILLIDEGWKILSNIGADYIKTIAKTARKFNLGLIITTQQLEDFNNEEGRALLENTSFTYIFRQKEITRNKEQLKGNFGLTDGDLEFLKEVGPGDGILLWNTKTENKKYRIRFILTRDELKFAESNKTALKTIIPNEIISIKKKIKSLSSTIKTKTSLNLDTALDERLMAYYNSLQSSLQDMKKEMQTTEGAFDIDEENIEDFVLEDRGIYSLNVRGDSFFGLGVGSDEIKYLLQEGYREYSIEGDLKKLFGDEVFYIKTTIIPEQLFIYAEYLNSLLNKNYSKYIIGSPAIEHDSISMQVRIPKSDGKFYIYKPKDDSAQIMEIKNNDVLISQAPQRYDFFKEEIMNDNSIYIHDMISGNNASYLETQFDIIKDKILYDVKRVYIRVAYDYFMPFSKEEIMFADNSEFYYVILTDELLNKFIGPEGKIPREYFRYDQSKELFKAIFGF